MSHELLSNDWRRGKRLRRGGAQRKISGAKTSDWGGVPTLHLSVDSRDVHLYATQAMYVGCAQLISF